MMNNENNKRQENPWWLLTKAWWLLAKVLLSIVVFFGLWLGMLACFFVAGLNVRALNWSRAGAFSLFGVAVYLTLAEYKKAILPWLKRVGR